MTVAMSPLTSPPFAGQPRRSTHYLSGLSREIAASEDLWRPRVRFPTEERWWTRLHDDDLVDVWLITWPVGAKTELHDHGGSAAAFVVTEGRLSEVRPSATGPGLMRTDVSAGHHHIVESGTIHDVGNPGPTAAISIHAYSPPLASMTFYDTLNGVLVPTHDVATDEPELKAS